MGRFQRILYVERRRGGSTRAFSYAVRVALRHGAALTLAGPAAGRRLERMAELVEIFGLPLGVEEVGSAVERLLEAAGRHDLVLTVGRVRRGLWPFPLGTLERRLLRESPCPTWILHPAQSPDVRVVAAAVDVATDAGLADTRGVLRAAAGLAAAVGAQLHVVHCWTVVGESMRASRTRGGSWRGARRAVTQTERRRRERLEACLSEEGIQPSSVVLPKGGVVPGILEATWQLEADVVVAGTARRTGLSGLVMGNTAERLVGRVPASVLAVPLGAGEKGWAERGSARRAEDSPGRAVASPWRRPEGSAGDRRAS